MLFRSILTHSRIVSQRTAHYNGQTVGIVSRRRIPIEGTTLAPVIASYLTSGASEHAIRAVRTTLKRHFGLASNSSDAEVAAAGAAVPCHDFQAFPDVVRAAAENREDKSAKNCAWAARLLQKHAAAIGYPLVFAAARPWEEIRDVWLPTTVASYNVRLGLTYAARAAEADRKSVV